MERRTKYDMYQQLKNLLEAEGYVPLPPEEIKYGLQFTMLREDQKHRIRIFESKKHGVRADLSQIKDAETVQCLEKQIRGIALDVNDHTRSKPKETPIDLNSLADIEENSLIGTDESGKGDYFGPLVVAGVYGGPSEKRILREIGIDDSKRLTDTRITAMAKEVKAVCRHSLVVIPNLRYNALYAQIGNLNRLLAWGHARVIENLLEQTPCNIALSDQFGSKASIENALMTLGRQIHLEQRPRAEENIIVAAASVLARADFVAKMKQLSDTYDIELPLGASDRTLAAAKAFVEKHGVDQLSQVAKLHFKTTERI